LWLQVIYHDPPWGVCLHPVESASLNLSVQLALSDQDI
jgi:hypothetical protein